MGTKRGVEFGSLFGFNLGTWDLRYSRSGCKAALFARSNAIKKGHGGNDASSQNREYSVSGGGMRGLAYVGVLEALQRRGENLCGHAET